MTISNWREDALCTQVGPEPFFLQKGGSAAPAKKVCMVCPVRQQCLEFALEHKAIGVWGGTTDEERRAIMRERLLARTGRGERHVAVV